MNRHFAVGTAVLALLPAAAARGATSAPTPLGDIIVTATRHAAPLQRVPISISAYDQQTMDAKGIRDIADLARFTPGVTFNPTNNQISIRGVTSTAGAGTTGIYIDDTPIQMRAIGFASDDTLPAVFDLDRIEILRGPQGTLFGAGSEGGTIRYITPQPNLQRTSSYARAEIAGMAHGGLSYEAGGAVGTPIVSDHLAIRLSAWHRRDGGWVDRVDNRTHQVTERNANSTDTTTVAGALAWSPLLGLTITPSVHFQDRVRHDTNDFWVGISDPEDGVFRNGSPDKRRDPDRFILPALKIEAKLGAMQLISNTSWYDRREVGSYDGTVYNLSYYQQFLAPPPDLPPGDPNPNDPDHHYPLLTPTGINPDLPPYLAQARVLNRQHSFTQEIRLQSSDPDARLNWTVGLFYQNNRQLSVETIADPDVDTLFEYLFQSDVVGVLGEPLYKGRYGYIAHTAAHDRHVAIFGQANYELLSGLRATVGLRYERLSYDFRNFTDGPENGGRVEASGGDKAHPLTPKLGLSYQVDPNNMVYASWSRGYRAGGATSPVPTDVCADDLAAFGLTHTPSSYKPDRVSSFEIGAKSSLLDRRLRIAASFYQLDWRHIQQFVLLPNCSSQYTDNLGDARVRGFELQMTLQAARGLSINATAGYTDARYTTDGHPTGGTAVLDRKGDVLGGAPWTATLGIQYDTKLRNFPLYIRTDILYQSANHGRTPEQDPSTVIFDPGAIQPSALTEVNLRAGTHWRSLDLSLFVNNLLDAAPRLHREHMDANTLLFTEDTLRPRTFGLTLIHRM